MSQDYDEDKALKRLLKWTANNKKLADSDSSLERYPLSLTWGQAVSAIKEKLD